MALYINCTVLFQDYLKDAGSQLKVAANEFETFIEKTLDRKK